MKYDVVALGELLIDFTLDGKSNQGNNTYEANPGGAPCNVLAMLNKMDKKTAFIGKVGQDAFGQILKNTIDNVGISSEGLVFDDKVNTTLAFVNTDENGERSFSFYRNPGADMMLTEEEVPHSVTCIIEKIEKSKNSEIYKKLSDLIYFMKKNIERFLKFKAFLWTLDSRNIKAKKYNVSTEEELEEQTKLVNSFLKLAYWY